MADSTSHDGIPLNDKEMELEYLSAQFVSDSAGRQKYHDKNNKTLQHIPPYSYTSFLQLE